MNTRFRNLENPKLEQKVHIRFERVILVDEDPDLSFLEQSYEDVEDAAERAKYLEQDKERLRAFHRGDWHMTGVRVAAHIMVPIGGDSFTCFTLESAGLWGVESDAEESYLAEIETTEKAELVDAIKAMGEAAAGLEG